MSSALYLTNRIRRIFIVLVHCNNSPRRKMSPHSETVSWFRATQIFLSFLIFKLDQKKHSDLYQADVCNPHTMTKPLRWCNAWLACSPRVRYIVGSRQFELLNLFHILIFTSLFFISYHLLSQYFVCLLDGV
jgi:hypothetical protein